MTQDKSCSACDCACAVPHHIAHSICKCGHALLAHHGKNTIHVDLTKPLGEAYALLCYAQQIFVDQCDPKCDTAGVNAMVSDFWKKFGEFEKSNAFNIALSEAEQTRVSDEIEAYALNVYKENKRN